MLKMEKTRMYPNTLVDAIRGMRNPMNSWDKTDTMWDIDSHTLIIGPNDVKLMKNLISAGSDHAKFMRMITISFDITAPLYWWKEFDTYKIGTVANSCSTMHKIQDHEFTLEDFSCEYLQEEYIDKVLKTVIDALNENRTKFLETNHKQYWWNMIQLLPSSFNQKRTIMTNYAVLRNMYHARKNHKLDEWSVDFCKAIEKIPYSELITMEA